MGHWHSGIYLAMKRKKENSIPRDSMDGPGDAKWSKPVRERQIPYDFAHMWNLMNIVN